MLHVGIFILRSPDLCKDVSIVNFASSVLRYFVSDFAKVHGKEYVSHNIHGTIHLGNEVLRYGCLDNFSAFPFENFLQGLKKLVRKFANPLQQIARRYEERERARRLPEEPLPSASFRNEHFGGPLPSQFRGPQYSSLTLRGFSLDLSDANSCCGLDDGGIIVVENFVYSLREQCMVALGRQFSKLLDFYTTPCPSSGLGIFEVRNLGALRAYVMMYGRS